MSSTTDPAPSPAKKHKMTKERKKSKKSKKEEEEDAAAAVAAARKAMPHVLVVEQDSAGNPTRFWSTPSQLADRIPQPKKDFMLWAIDTWKTHPHNRPVVNGAVWNQTSKEVREKFKKLAEEEAERYKDACERHWEFYETGGDFYVYK